MPLNLLPILTNQTSHWSDCFAKLNADEAKEFLQSEELPEEFRIRFDEEANKEDNEIIKAELQKKEQFIKKIFDLKTRLSQINPPNPSDPNALALIAVNRTPFSNNLSLLNLNYRSFNFFELK